VPICEGFNVQITIDSSEPLDKVLKVVGALYGVTLGEATEGLMDPGPPDPKPRTAKKNIKQSRVTATDSKTTSRSTRSARRKSKTKTAPDPTSVRTWAKTNGHPVRDRGPVPASVTAAYLAAGAHET
jgi:Lsr2